MKKKSVLKLLILAVVLIVSVSFAGCSLDGNAAQFDDSGLSRDMSDNKPTEFTATVVVIQDPKSVNTFPVGLGGNYRTTEEMLYGSIIYSNWGVLTGATVTMSNFTNFKLSSPLEDGSYPITGTNHSDIEIVMLNEEIITLKANGQIEGAYPAVAELNMNFSSIKSYGKISPANINGTLTGNFIWAWYEVDPTELPFELPEKPFGVFTLTGTYN